MEATRPATRTLVVTTTPTRTHGLDELHEALGRGWRIVHLAVLEHILPGEEEAWPEGRFSSLMLLELPAGGHPGAWNAPAAAAPACPTAFASQPLWRS